MCECMFGTKVIHKIISFPDEFKESRNMGLSSITFKQAVKIDPSYRRGFDLQSSMRNPNAKWCELNPDSAD